MSKQVHIDMDDVVAVTQTLASVIQRKGLPPDEFKQVRGSWENLMDAVSKLQRNAVINKLYPEEPPKSTAPVQESAPQVVSQDEVAKQPADLSIPAVAKPSVIQQQVLPSDPSVAGGVQES